MDTFFLAAFFLFVVLKFIIVFSWSLDAPIRVLSHSGFCRIKLCTDKRRIVDSGRSWGHDRNLYASEFYPPQWIGCVAGIAQEIQRMALARENVISMRVQQQA